MLQKISDLAEDFLNNSKNKKVRVISHFDTDGITSAVILSKTLSRLNIPFTIRILKNLETEFIEELKKELDNEIVIFSDLASGHLEELKEIENVYILDHHQINKEVPENIKIINPQIFDKEEISAAGLCYLFSKAISKNNVDLANLAIIGMVGDMLEKNLGKLNNEILNDSEEVIIKKGLLLFGATRPLSKALEFSSSMFIPGVTGNHIGAVKLLRELNINKNKTIFELEEEEISKLLTAILVRKSGDKKELDKIIGNIYLVKFFNKLEDARELSSLINACSRLGRTDVSLCLCLGSKKARKKAEKIYAQYRQEIVAGMNFANNNKNQGKGYVIIDAEDNIKDSMIGTITSILSFSSVYEEGTVLVGLANSGKKIKISSRISGRNGRDLCEMLTKATNEIDAEAGGHKQAAGCLIPKDKKEEFLKSLKKELEIETIKI